VAMVTITEHSTEGKNMKMKDLKNHFLLLQINDSLFPIGGYSHSYGLETYIQKGIVHNSELAAEYIRKRLLYNFLYTDFLAVRLAYDAALQEDETAIDELEDQMEASRIPSELREASRKLGSRFIKTLLHMQITPPSGFFSRYLQVRRGKTTCHPCAYGVLCACMGMDRTEVLSAFLYAQTSAMVTNCVKTIPLSQSDGQKILFSLEPLMENMIQLVEQIGAEMLCASTPAFDLRSMEHETLYSRLYMS